MRGCRSLKGAYRRGRRSRPGGSGLGDSYAAEGGHRLKTSVALAIETRIRGFCQEENFTSGPSGGGGRDRGVLHDGRSGRGGEGLRTDTWGKKVSSLGTSRIRRTPMRPLRGAAGETWMENLIQTTTKGKRELLQRGQFSHEKGSIWRRGEARRSSTTKTRTRKKVGPQSFATCSLS